ncbi:MAG TPA: hypothetical protein VGH50_03745 [Candidatus Binatia bacterium]
MLLLRIEDMRPRAQFAKALVYFVYCVAVDRPLSLAVRLFAGFLCAFVLGACAASSNQSAPPGAAVIEAPDYTKQGGTWTYRVVHQMWTGGYRSDMENGDFEIQMRNGKHRRFRLEGDQKTPVTGPTWLAAMLPTTALIQAKEQYFNFPLWVGKEWKGWRFLGHWRDSHHTVTGVETIKTTAGAFETYRIERRFVMYGGILNYYDTHIYYYCPQTRSVIKYDYTREMKDLVGDVKYGLEETASVELLSYKPEPESSKKASAN